MVIWNVALVVVVALLELSALAAGLMAGVSSLGFSVFLESLLRRQRRAHG